ncbi:MAG: sulfatase-like hydrolase/transferase [Chloroflexi bacterium]|nr:sulfatase-like hydrolase/transferase [Chloroflexota bacterium]
MNRRPPNLLVIMCDQLRATALGLYGNPQVRTPHLENLAATGTLFRHAFTPYPVCVPARVALWTGRWPHLTGSRTNSVLLQPGEIHLPQLLRDAGYTTGLIGKNHCFTDGDLARYFDTYYPAGHGGPAGDGGDPEIAAAREWVRGLEGRSAGIVRRAGGGNGAAYAAGISPYPIEKHGTWLIGEHADRFLRVHRDRPFCAWVSIADPHTPYQVSEPYASLYRSAGVQLPPPEPPGYPGKPDRLRTFAELMGAPEVADDHLRFVLSIYYGMIGVIDDVVGRLMRTLDELGLREDTIVVFTADHGDYMTEHRLVRKGASLHDSLVRIPLLLSFPGKVPAETVSDDLVSLLDVFPTLTQLMHVPQPPGRSGRPLPLRPGGAEAPRRRAIFAEHGLEGMPAMPAEARRALDRYQTEHGRPRPAPWQVMANGKLKMVRTHEWKYVHAPNLPDSECELYNLVDDPGELVNLIDRPEHRERVHDIRRQLLDWAITTEDTLPPAAPNRE